MLQTPNAPSRQLDFRDHRRELHDNLYVYAVVSRRARGLSIGINLNPDKVCNFDCPYCQVDRTVPGRTATVDLERLEAELDDLLARVADGTLWTLPPFDTAAEHLRVVRDVAFAGDGEPTSSRAFPDAVSVVGRMRDKYGLKNLQISLLTNATLLSRPRVALGLERLAALGGVVWAKLDAGTDAWFHRVDGTKLPLQSVVRQITGAAQQNPLVLQCLFPTLDGTGPSDDEVAAWSNRIAEILAAGGQIREVQVTTIARTPADPTVGALPVHRLEQIADYARALGLVVNVYPGLAPTQEST